MKAPNQTNEQYARQGELYHIQRQRELTMDELLELRELTRIATSHLTIKTMKG